MNNSKLKQLCQNTVKSAPLKKPFKISLSPKTYKTLVNWQMKDRFPSLLLFRRGRGTYLARVA